jgi:hypothetical protein
MFAVTRVAQFFARTSIYYPFFLASDYTPLDYAPYYVPPPLLRASKPPNCVSINRTNTKFAIQLFRNFSLSRSRRTKHSSEKKRNCSSSVGQILANRRLSTPSSTAISKKQREK